MLAFAHRGGFRVAGRRNSLAAFRRALTHGARALETDGWLAPDGRLVLAHDRPREWFADALTLDQLYAAVGTGFDLSVDLPDGNAAAAAAQAAADVGALDRLWVCLRGSAPEAALDLADQLGGPVRVVLSADRLSAEDIRWAAGFGCAAVNQPARRWRSDLRRVALDAGVLAFGYACNTEPVLWRARRLRLDAVYSDRLRLVRAAAGGTGPAGSGPATAAGT